VSCTHGRFEDYAQRHGDVQIWRCSHCGRAGRWDGGWSYYGTGDCRRCAEPVIDFVACSASCRQALRPRVRALRAELRGPR
jgi:NAD-dependent SIR2 family protein deacetylase